ncbi:MAG: hypothetical protein RJB66_2588 [Pseudomonadota bacterium]|jgi:hypothetical protein
MLTSPRVIIASVYGRGHWLAVELVRAGFNVQLLELTSRISKALPEDHDGPFGYFSSPRWESLERDSLGSLGELKEKPHGYTVWLKSGPWEFAGPTSSYRAEALKQTQEAKDFVRNGSDPNVDRGGWSNELKKADFDFRWFASLASDFQSNQGRRANDAFQNAIPSGLFEKYLTRNPETFDLKSSLKWCFDQGVVVVEDADIPDVAVENRRVQGVEVKGRKSGFVRCEQLIWTLTSAETEQLSLRVFLKLFKGRIIEPEWCWMRYKIQFDESVEFHQLPSSFLMIDDLHVPWTNENFVTFRKGQFARHYHVWMRLPYSQRFHSEYLAERIEPVLLSLRNRCPRLKAKLLTLPLEAQSHSKEIGPCIFPIYRYEDLINPPGLSFFNLWYSHPENWPSYGIEPILYSQKKIIAEMQKWWGDLTEEQKKKELEL